MAKRKKSSSNTPSQSHEGTPGCADDGNSKQDLIVVLPGDNISQHIRPVSSTDEMILLGSGLRRRTTNGDDSAVYATLSGCLQYNLRSGGSNKKKKHVYWIRSSNSAPLQIEDRVVGVVQERVGPDGAGGDYYRLFLGNAETTAILSNLSFEGATKRNKPTLEAGQVLYARISEWIPELEPVLSCQLGPHDSSAIKSKDWMTNEGIYGILHGGTVLSVASGLARVLLTPSGVALWESVSKHELTSKFEVAIGVNGLIWLHASPNPEAVVVLQNAILNSQLLTPEQTAGMVQQLAFTMRKEMQKQEDSMG